MLFSCFKDYMTKAKIDFKKKNSNINNGTINDINQNNDHDEKVAVPLYND